jgi:choline-sulfatase
MRRLASETAALLVIALLGLGGCGGERAQRSSDSVRGPSAASAAPSLLLVTLDTTRADAVAPEAADVTPNLARLAAGGRTYRHAYTTAPQTLPAHASLLTGSYPSQHGVHENGRALAPNHELLAEQLRAAGWSTGAFVSAWVLDRQFGLARGFDTYDDALSAGAQERSAGETTDRALAWLAGQPAGKPLFLWVHYFDAHAPYAPPEPWSSRFAGDPYRGEVAYVDAELGRLVTAFTGRSAPGGHRIAVVGDHGESLGDHGEAQHGRLLYQGVMRVPLVLAGDGVPAGEATAAVSTRRLHDTLLAWAGLPGPSSLLGDVAAEVVLGEAMQPYLSHGWQPQVMAVDGRWKAIRAGALELYDLAADPTESRDLAGEASPDRRLLTALRDYPLPGAEATAATVDEETRRRLAALGYITSAGARPVAADAPRPADMVDLFADLDRASGSFAAGRYAEAAPLFARLAERDPNNLMVAVQVAVSHSLLGHDAEAVAWFERARRIDPGSPELQHYLGQHHCARGEWEAALPLLTAAAAREPDRLPTLECLARAHEAGGRPAEAAELFERIAAKKREPLADLVRAGGLRMAAGDTTAAIADFEAARGIAGDHFENHLELGVLYLAARRLPEARDALDAVPGSHPGRPMALFKRAQVSVLLGEADARERVQAATAAADETTRPLIAGERLFAGLR